MKTCPDAELNGLLLDRVRLLDDLAPVLRRVGPNHPKRASVNAKRRARRLEVRRALRANASAIAARCVELYTP